MSVIKILIVGIGATFAMDIWSYVLNLFGITSLDYKIVGRWIGSIPKGRFFHNKIMDTPPIQNELFLGWVSHYLIGIAFAFLLFVIYSKDWFEKPTLMPAIIIGIVTIIAPFFIMQPAFGFGVACSKLSDPNTIRFKSFMAHLVYGFGLYGAAILFNMIEKVFK